MVEKQKIQLNVREMDTLLIMIRKEIVGYIVPKKIVNGTPLNPNNFYQIIYRYANKDIKFSFNIFEEIKFDLRYYPKSLFFFNKHFIETGRIEFHVKLKINFIDNSKITSVLLMKYIPNEARIISSEKSWENLHFIKIKINNKIKYPILDRKKIMEQINQQVIKSVVTKSRELINKSFLVINELEE